jgi:hypothetical protein
MRWPLHLSITILVILAGSSLFTDSWARGGGGRGGGYRGGSHTGGGGHLGVGPYTKRDGTFVQPHHRTAPNSTQRDNFGSKPNVNPYTGQPGTREPTR